MANNISIVPTIIEERRPGQSAQAYDIFSRLLKERIIFLAGPITGDSSNLIVAQLLYLASGDPKKDIQLYINTPGGHVTAGLAIYDTMQYIEPDVSTVCVGLAASMGALLLAAGAKGKRFALPNSEILLHQVMGSATGPAAEIEITAKQISKIKNKINKIIAKHCDQPLRKVEKDTDRDFYLSAKEAQNYGIIDEVIQPKRQLVK